MTFDNAPYWFHDYTTTPWLVARCNGTFIHVRSNLQADGTGPFLIWGIYAKPERGSGRQPLNVPPLLPFWGATAPGLMVDWLLTSGALRRVLELQDAALLAEVLATRANPGGL